MSRKHEISRAIRASIPDDATDLEVIEALHLAMDWYVGSLRYDVDHEDDEALLAAVRGG